MRVEQVSNRMGSGTGVRVEQIPSSRAPTRTDQTPAVRGEQGAPRIGTPSGSVRVEQVSNAGQKVSIVTR